VIFGIRCASHRDPKFTGVIKGKIRYGDPPRWHSAYSINIETLADFVTLLDEAGRLIVERRTAYDAENGPGREGDPVICVYDGWIE
jgi:hypothetical protein